MANKSKSLIALANLPLKDISSYLELVENFSKSNVNAVDTDKVAGVDSNKIAKAALKEDGSLLEDRNTVVNALKLGGSPASDYLKKDESTTLLDDTYQVSTIISNEVKEIRDEFYQAMAELAKGGYIKQKDAYDGFYDAFKYNEIKYNDSVICRVVGEHNASSKTLLVSDVTNLMIGEYIAIKDLKDNMYVSRIEDISNRQLTLNKSFGVTVLNETAIYKYAGSYYNGEFIFGKNNGAYVSTDTIKTIVKDGKNRTVINVLNNDSKGFATKLSNYYSTYGTMIRKVEFSLSYTGNPGNIKASIYKVIDDTEKNSPQCELLGTSLSVYPSSASNTLSEVEFLFEEPIKISEGSNYIIALYCGGATQNDTWRIGGYVDPYDGNSEQFFVDDTYIFDGNSFKLIPGSTDSYLSLYISKELNVDIQYGDTGLYTREVEINGGFTRARVELRVNREGIYQVASDAALATTTGSTLKIVGDKTNSFFTNDKVVVGQMFSTLTGDCTSTAIQMSDDMYTPADNDVYRVGYKVQVKASRKLSSVPLTYGDDIVVELPLTTIMKGKESYKEAYSSDRLIFEAEIQPDNTLDRLLKTYDKLEVQVAWNGALNAENINSKTQFAGKILDLTVATDKSYNKKK